MDLRLDLTPAPMFRKGDIAAEKSSSKHVRMVSLAHLATCLGLSRTTVSLVLGGRGKEIGIAEATQARVRQAAEEMGYRPNYHARAFNLGRSDTIGMCSPVLAGVPAGPISDFWAQVHAGVVSRAGAYGSDVLTVASRETGSGIPRGLQFLHSKRIDALIIPGHLHWDPSQVPASTAVVTVMPWIRHDLPSVDLDPLPGIRAAIAHLAALGHQRIGYVGFQDHLAVSRDRGRMVTREALAHGIISQTRLLTVRKNISDLPVAVAIDEIAASAGALIDNLRKATALLCYNDIVALGLMRAANARGLRVPGDLSLIGFDDVAGAYATPRLTTISHALFDIGTAAADLALGLLHPMWSRQRRKAPPSQLVPSFFVPGSTTGPVPGVHS